MRVTILNQFYVPSLAPTAHLAASVAEHRAAGGDEVTVIAGLGSYTGERTPCDARNGKDNPRLCRIWTMGAGRTSMLVRLVDYLVFYIGSVIRMTALPAQDVIVAMTTPPYIVMAALVHKLFHRRTRVLLWNQDLFPDGIEIAGGLAPASFVSRALRRLNAFIYRRVEKVICLDDAMRDRCREMATPADAERFCVLPNWEQEILFAERPDSAAHCLTNIPDLSGKFVVLYLGNAGYMHDFETVLAAARELRNEKVAFLFVGGGVRWDELTHAKDAEGLDNLFVHTYVPREVTPALMERAHCALVTLAERAGGVCSPSKMHASLAMGLPLVYVGPTGSNVDEAINRFGCGVSVRHGNVSGLIECLIRMARDEELLNAYRASARDAFRKAYSDSQALPRFNQLIDRRADDDLSQPAG